VTIDTKPRGKTRAEEWNFNQERAATVLAAALSLARVEGYQWITREGVAAQAGVSDGTVSNAFGTMRDLKRAVVTEAVRLGDLTIIGQAVASGSPLVDGVDPAVKQRALASLAN
jgi:AcrR family transcriptional regulator